MNKKIAMFHGIQVYEILEGGNLLNAIYTNTGLSQDANCAVNNESDITEEYIIDSEIARKRKYDDKGLEGLYCCRYIETTNHSVVIHCDLKIKKRNGVYEFTWLDKDDEPIWKGLGLIAGTTHIAVSYVEA